MATVTSWAGTMADIGPMYPFIGSELMMVVGAVAFWIVWHVLQTRGETREYEQEMAQLRKGDAASKVLEREG